MPQTGRMSGRSQRVDQLLESAILDLLARRAASATICPSDAAREVGDDDSWRELMGPNYPAMAVVEVRSLIEDAARIEIETTAVVP